MVSLFWVSYRVVVDRLAGGLRLVGDGGATLLQDGLEGVLQRTTATDPINKGHVVHEDSEWQREIGIFVEQHRDCVKVGCRCCRGTGRSEVKKENKTTGWFTTSGFNPTDFRRSFCLLIHAVQMLQIPFIGQISRLQLRVSYLTNMK